MEISADIFGCFNWRGVGESVLLACNVYRPEMLLYVSQYTGQAFTAKNYLVQNISSAENEKPWPNLMDVKRKEMAYGGQCKWFWNGQCKGCK